MVTIVERRQGKNMAKLYSENGVEWHYHSIGLGQRLLNFWMCLDLGRQKEIFCSALHRKSKNFYMT